MELVLQQKQEVSLRMTAELRQAIELLQYSTYELEQYIRQQELDNPLIELTERDDDSSFRERVTGQSFTGESSLLIQKQIETPREHLLKLVNMTFHEQDTRNLLRHIIYNLDDHGFLDQRLMEELGYEESEVTDGILLLQQIGPAGIGARSLKECLLLQIRQQSPRHQLAEQFVNDHLEWVAERRWNDIAKAMKLSLKQVKDLYEYMLTFNPRPLVHLSDSSTEYVIPDVLVEVKDDQIHFCLNDGYLPKIGLSDLYSTAMLNNTEAAKFVAPYYKHIEWLVASIEQRRATLIKIVETLVKKQSAFFKQGFIALQPMTLKGVADEIGVHESTVSRATANKVIQTSFGSFEMRSLFTSQLHSADGNHVSQTKVKALLKKLIDQEDKARPYSDQKIAEYFNTEKGIAVSRRTISKYREELQIPTSSKRKGIGG